MIDFGIESVTNFGGFDAYWRIWLVEFRDCSQAIVVEDIDNPTVQNYVLVPEGEPQAR